MRSLILALSWRQRSTRSQASSATSPSTPAMAAATRSRPARVPSPRGHTSSSGWQLVEMPPQPVGDGGALTNERVAMIDQQPHLAGGPVELGGGQVGLTQRRSRHRQPVDRVRLAALAPATALGGHQLRRHARHGLADRQQVRLQPARQMPTVLDRHAPLSATATPNAAAPDVARWWPSPSCAPAGARRRLLPPRCGCACAHRCR